LGHRGRGEPPGMAETMIGSIAERVVIESPKPVLVALSPAREVKNILVAYDGSEPARGALLAGEKLSSAVGKPLKITTVISSESQMPEAHLTVEQGQSYLREQQDQNVFEIRIGSPARVLLDEAHTGRSLLVIGAYGYRTPDATVLGSTTTYVLRRAQSTVLVYR